MKLTRLRHRLDRDHSIGNAHAQRDRGRALAAMRDAQHCLVGCADRRFLGFEGDMGGGSTDGSNDADGAENQLAKHLGSPESKDMNGERSIRPRG